MEGMNSWRTGMKETFRLLIGCLAAASCAASTAHAQDIGGALYTMGNEPEGNTVVVYARGVDGRLSLTDRFATGGLGTGVGLGSQGALALNEDGTRLFVVNAGSDDFSAFQVRGDSLELVDRIPSG